MYAIIIPARYKSSRFPGKPLADIGGKSLIRRVWDRCQFDVDVFIATDDDGIRNHCEGFGANVLMTPESCMTGTDRVFEATKQLGERYDFFVNIQGDEPLICTDDISKVVESHMESTDMVTCGMASISTEEDFRNPNITKVVVNSYNDLLYISRSPIPTTKDNEFVKAHRQVCIYAFERDHLSVFGSVDNKGSLEEIEDIEILRFFDLGIKVRMVEVSGNSIPVDVPEDIDRVLNEINRHS